jgi:hypothetical protein
MDQSVMVFAGTAARGSAIPSPSEGMVTYREDDDIVEVFDGSSFVQVGSEPGLVAVKSALFTGVQSASVTAGNNVAVTDLSITHTLADASNKLIVSAYFGAAANSHGEGSTGIAVADDGNLIGVGDAAGGRIRVGAGGYITQSGGNDVVAMPSVSFVYEPGDTSSHVFTVRAVNMRGDTRTLYINRTEIDSDVGGLARTSSALIIQEVAV